MAGFGLNTQTIGGMAGLIIVFLIIYFVMKLRSHRAEWGTFRERRVERKTGLGPFGRMLRQTLRSVRSIKKHGKVEKKKVNGAAKKKGEKTKSGKKAGKAATEGAKAAEETEKSAEALTAIQGRALGLIAGLKLIEQAIEKYVQRESQEENKEQQEIQYIGGLIGRISQIINYNKIDSNTLSYLENFIDNLLSYLRAEIGTEEGKEKDMKELISQLKEAIKEMKQVLVEAKTESGVFKKYERKAKKDYGKGIRAIGVAIWKRRAKLIQQIMKFKNADRELIAKLKMQIAMLGKLYNSANKLNAQLKKTFKMIDNGVKETRWILRRLLRLDRKMSSFDKTVNKTESRVEKKFKQMRESFAKFERSIKSFESDRDVNSVALSFSANLREYVKENKDLGVMTSEFDKSLRNILTMGFLMVKLTESYEKIVEGLTQSEEVVSQGERAFERVLQAAASESEIQMDEKEVSETLGQLGSILNYGKKIEKYLSNLTMVIEYKLRKLYPLINLLVEEDMRVVNTLEKSSSNFVQLMAGAHDRVTVITGRNVGAIEKFENQLGKENADIASSYSQARRVRFGT